MRSLSTEAKVIVLVAILTILVGVGGSRIVGGLFEGHVEKSALDALVGAAREFDSQERAEVEKLSSTLDALLANDDIAAAFVARDRERLLALCAPLFETMRSRDRITHWYFIEAPPDQTVFLRVHRPELHSDRVERTTYLKAVETGEVGAGKELGQTAFALRVVRPWFRDGKLLGYMELSEEIDHFLSAMKRRTGDEYGILVKKEYLDEKAWSQILGARANTWNDRPDVVVVDTTIFNLGIADFHGDLAKVPDGGEALEEIVQEGRAWIRGIFPLRDADGRKVGGLFVLHDFTPIHRSVTTAIVQTIFIMVAFSLFAAVVLATALHLAVFRRLDRLAARIEATADAAGAPPERVVQMGTHDALVRLEALFERLLPPQAEPPAGDAPPRTGPTGAGSQRPGP